MALRDPDWISVTERLMASGSKSPSTAKREDEDGVDDLMDCERGFTCILMADRGGISG